MEQFMDAGNRRRSMASTSMNATSSRSHSIFIITVESQEFRENGEEHIVAGRLNLVDLAGSERVEKTGATGDRLKEGVQINLSLSALGNCIAALVEGKSHVPYRDSKLTRLLQNSLGGNAKTLMVANLSPASYNEEETLSTLRYASRAKKIKNKPKINEDPKDSMIRQLQDEIKMLKKLLEERNSGKQEEVKRGQVAPEIQIVEKVVYVEKDNPELLAEIERLKRELNEKNQMMQNLDAALSQEIANLRRQLDEAIKNPTVSLAEIDEIKRELSAKQQEKERTDMILKNEIQNLLQELQQKERITTKPDGANTQHMEELKSQIEMLTREIQEKKNIVAVPDPALLNEIEQLRKDLQNAQVQPKGHEEEIAVLKKQLKEKEDEKQHSNDFMKQEMQRLNEELNQKRNEISHDKNNMEAEIERLTREIEEKKVQMSSVNPELMNQIESLKKELKHAQENPKEHEQEILRLKKELQEKQHERYDPNIHVQQEIERLNKELAMKQSQMHDEQNEALEEIRRKLEEQSKLILNQAPVNYESPAYYYYNPIYNMSTNMNVNPADAKQIELQIYWNHSDAYVMASDQYTCLYYVDHTEGYKSLVIKRESEFGPIVFEIKKPKFDFDFWLYDPEQVMKPIRVFKKGLFNYVPLWMLNTRLVMQKYAISPFANKDQVYVWIGDFGGDLILFAEPQHKKVAMYTRPNWENRILTLFPSAYYMQDIVVASVIAVEEGEREKISVSLC